MSTSPGNDHKKIPAKWKFRNLNLSLNQQMGWGYKLVPRRGNSKTIGVKFKQIRHFLQTSPKLIWILEWCWVCKRMIHLAQEMIKLTCPSHQSIQVVKTKPCTDKTATVACYLNLAEKPAGLGDVFLETIESMSATKTYDDFPSCFGTEQKFKAGKYFTPSKVWNHLNISERTSFRK